MCYKMAILVRSDIKMSKGKVLAQVSHAVVEATIKAYTSTTLFYKWQTDGDSDYKIDKLVGQLKLY